MPDWTPYAITLAGWIVLLIWKLNDFSHLKDDYMKHEKKNDEHFKKIYEKIDDLTERLSHLEGKLNNN